MPDPRPDVEMRTWRVHVPLGILFGVLWLLTALHLLVGLHDEVFQWNALFILNCAAPPLMPVACLLAGRVGVAGANLGVLAIVVLPWWWAARNPESRGRFRIAAAVIVVYWMFIDFGLALSA